MLKATATASISLDSPVAGFPSVHDERKPGGTPGKRGMEGKRERFSSVNEKNPRFSKDAYGRFPCIRSLSAISALVCFLIGTHQMESLYFFAKTMYIPLWLECTSLQYLVLVGRDILRNIPNPTIQNTTQVIDGSCIHWLVFPQLLLDRYC